MLGAGGDVQMAEMGGDVEEGARLLGKRAERMRRPSARSFLDYQDEDGSDSEASLGGDTFPAIFFSADCGETLKQQSLPCTNVFAYDGRACGKA